MSKITIGNATLFYKVIGKFYNLTSKDYIITYISDYNPKLDVIIKQIFDKIQTFYNSRTVNYANQCGENSQYICNNLKIEGINITTGKIIISDWAKNTKGNFVDTKNWIKNNEIIIEQIDKVYGKSVFATIGAANYHALPYLEIPIDTQTYYVAIETTIEKPYKLQFYIGHNIKEFKDLITIRYQCKSFQIEVKCDKSWMDIIPKEEKPLNPEEIRQAEDAGLTRQIETSKKKEEEDKNKTKLSYRLNPYNWLKPKTGGKRKNTKKHKKTKQRKTRRHRR